jgi:hypothetical protein
MNTGSFTAQTAPSKNISISPIIKILLVVSGGVFIFFVLLSGIGFGYER